MSEFEKTKAPVFDVSSVEVPSDHAEVLNFIHSSYNKTTRFGYERIEMEIFNSFCVRGKNILMAGPVVVVKL